MVEDYKVAMAIPMRLRVAHTTYIESDASHSVVDTHRLNVLAASVNRINWSLMAWFPLILCASLYNLSQAYGVRIFADVVFTLSV